MRRVAWACGERMVEAFETFENVTRERALNGAIVVVPFEMETAKDFAVPIGCEVIMRLEGGDEVLNIRFVGVFDTEVVNYQTESDRAGGVLEEAWGVFGWVVACICKVSC